MNLTGLTRVEKLALLDLLILGMYSDYHLSLAEDRKIQAVLDSFSFITKKARYACIDTAITRVRRHLDSFEEARDYAMGLMECFSTTKHRKQAWDALYELLVSDRNRLNDDKKKFLAVVTKAVAKYQTRLGKLR